MTTIKRLSVVLLDEIRNLKTKPNTTPMTKQINILAIGQAISAGAKVAPGFIPIQIETETV